MGDEQRVHRRRCPCDGWRGLPAGPPHPLPGTFPGAERIAETFRGKPLPLPPVKVSAGSNGRGTVMFSIRSGLTRWGVIAALSLGALVVPATPAKSYPCYEGFYRTYDYT